MREWKKICLVQDIPAQTVFDTLVLDQTSPASVLAHKAAIDASYV